MAELTPRERLQPSLLDRLTDDEPDKKQEARIRRVLSPRRFRELVRRDLAWLLNTGQLAATVDLDEYPLVGESVVNYGIPDLSGHSVSDLEFPAIERLIKDAIVAFEPRILRRGLKVTIVHDKESSGNTITFLIEGRLWAQPLPEQLYMRTRMDLESGGVKVEDFAGRGSG